MWLWNLPSVILSIPLSPTVGQKTKKCWTKFVKQTVSVNKKLKRSDLVAGKNHKRYQYGHKIRNKFSVSKMAAVYHRCCWIFVILTQTQYWIIQFFIIWKSFSLKFTLALVKVMLNFFPSVYYRILLTFLVLVPGQVKINFLLVRNEMGPGRMS